MDSYSSSRNSVPSTNSNSDERSSNSPSDDGTNGYPVYNDVNKAPDNDLDDDANGSSLTSQTLNADGTPKRPMNAFMIFARRRRPQVSSENTSMRTGEISKILSREWNAMPPSEKQFYLDQAKQLKDTFNSKYPDYVYRRRPNNSRKRRRTDHSISHSSAPPGHSNGSVDPGDGLHGADLGESSPSEGGHGVHGHVDGPNSGSYLRMPPLGPHDTSQKYGGSTGVHHGLQSRLPFSAPTNNSAFPDLGSSFRGPDHRLPFLPPSHEPHRSNTLPSPRSSHLNSILPPQSHFSSGSQWDSGRERSSWPTTTSDRSTTRTSFSSSSSATPPLNGSSWSPPPTASSATQGSASNSTSTSGDFPSFPTLNSPFYPPSGNHPPSSAPPFSASPTQSSSHLPPDSSSDRHSSYQSHHRNSYPSSSPRGSHSQSYQRGGDLPRALPALNSITSSFNNGSVSDPLADFGSWRPSSGHGLGH